MTPEAILALIGATVGVLVGLLTLGLSRAPGCAELRWLGLIAAAAGAVGALIGLAGVHSDATALAMTRVGTSLTGVLMYAWLRYEASDREPSGAGHLIAPAALAFGVLALVPRVVIAGVVVRHLDAWTGTISVDVPPTMFGAAGLLGLILAATTLLCRYLARWRAREAGAGAHALGLAGLQVAALYETVNATWLHRSLHVLPLGLLWTLGAIGIALVDRFVQGASSLSGLSARLEQAVVERTRELASARASLVDVEQLATLGRLSSALAHEINNPISVIASNVQFVREAAAPEAGRDPEELQALDDALQGVERVASIVRQLGDAGQLASHCGSPVPVSLTSVVEAAIASARTRAGARLDASVEIPAALHVMTLEASLRQVVASVVVAAAEAMRAVDLDGAVRVRAEQRDDRVTLRIEDDSPEQDDILREKRFKQFFDARPTAVLGDVGLSVSLALLRLLGATIALERSDEGGSTVRIDLRAAEAPARHSGAPASSPAVRARVLVVDDDLLTRIGLRRLLGREYVIDEAAGVEEALALVREHRGELDAIVADLVMPDGGAERLVRELAREAPELAAATLLLTGGAVDGQTGTFLQVHADRVLRKPLNVATLRALIDGVRVRRGSGSLLRRGGP